LANGQSTAKAAAAATSRAAGSSHGRHRCQPEAGGLDGLGTDCPEREPAWSPAGSLWSWCIAFGISWISVFARVAYQTF
jgi:hypothetical protein